MHSFKRYIAYFLVCAILTVFLPADIHALEHHAGSSTSNGTASGTVMDPLYTGIPNRTEAVKPPQQLFTPDANTADVKETLADAAAALRQGLVERKSQITVTYPATAPFDQEDIWVAALAHTGNPKEGDYLLWQCNPAGWDPYLDASGNYYTTVYYPEYFTTAQQEAELDTAIANLLASLNLGQASDHDKVKAVYDWMCANITYDENSNGAYLLKHSAYAALIHKKAVCQGYAVLLYRLCLELGVDARVISGSADGQAHGWNIIKLDGLYYNADATWDAGKTAYQYFLRGSAAFSDHAADGDFDTAEFRQKYPVNPDDYGVEIPWPITGTCGKDTTWQLSKDGVLTISGSGAMDDYYMDYPAWFDYIWNVKALVVEKDVTYIGAYAFFYSSFLESVTIKGCTAIGDAAFLDCNGLKSVTMEQVTAIGSYSFMGCTGLTSVKIGAATNSIGTQAFNGCRSLTAISVEAANTSFKAEGNVLFSADLTRLLTTAADIGAAYVLPAQVTQLDEYAFANCVTLEQITIHDGIKSLPEGIFYDCIALRSVQLPAELETIADRAFSGCSKLEGIALPAALRVIGAYAFEDCTALAEIVLPQKLESIQEFAFCNCAGLKTVKFLCEAPEIAEQAFTGVSADASYPDPTCYKSWTHDKRRDYGGYLYWISYAVHSYTSAVTPPSCAEQGFTTYTCSHCANSYVGDYVAAPGHVWDQGRLTVEPSDSAPGERVYTCTVCTATQKEPVYSLDHTHSFTDTVTPPGCTTQGYTTHTCSQCGYGYTDTYVKATDHSMGEWTVVTVATCTEQGELRRDCSGCDHFESQEADALGHSYVNYVSDDNASCTQDGTKSAPCENGCGLVDTVSDPGSMEAHEFGDWYTDEPAGYGKDGFKLRDCQNCNYFEQEIIPALTVPDRLTSDVYAVGEATVSKISAGTTISAFLEGIPESSFVHVYADGTEAAPDALLATGMELHLVVEGQTVSKLTAVVTGDVNGDGAISVTDMLAIKAHLLKKSTLEGHFLAAADSSKDGGLSITDFLQLKAHILKKSTVTPH